MTTPNMTRADHFEDIHSMLISEHGEDGPPEWDRRNEIGMSSARWLTGIRQQAWRIVFHEEPTPENLIKRAHDPRAQY
ncbi:MAG: hypothetical protein ACRD2X_01375 [Vicinamibacteraceae bacterium]